MSTYSFIDVQATLVGPGGVVDLGNGAGVAAEGITIERNNDSGVMTIGADGTVMHALRAAKDGTITVRLLKTSQTNSKLSELYNLQQQSSLSYGRNTITVRNAATGDTTTASECGFKKFPSVSYSQDGEVMEWQFNCGRIETVLGTGDPEK